MQNGNGQDGNGTENGSGKEPGELHSSAEIIHFAEMRERRITQDAKGHQPEPEHVPAINLPPFTKYLAGILLAVHAGMVLTLSPEQQYDIIAQFGFTPARYTGGAPFDVVAALDPFTYMFLHGSWTHVLINTFMLVAFGAGLERWMGWRRMGLLMVSCGLASVAVHMALDIHSTTPVIGASGAISGMFAAIMLMLQRQGNLETHKRWGLWPMILVWVGISALFGVTGGPGGESIAWAAHIGGFLAGLALTRPIMRLPG